MNVIRRHYLLFLLKAIHGYRETERLNWNDANKVILERVKALAFPSPGNTLKYVHILDLHNKGYIKPHIDAVRVCLFGFV